MTNFLSYTDLKAIYPVLGIKVLSRDEGVVKAVQTLRGKALPILFTGETDHECEFKALLLWHAERKRLGLPTLTKPAKAVPAPIPVPVAVVAPKPVPAASKPVPVVVQAKPAAVKDDREWINDGDEERQVLPREKKVLLGIGWEIGRLKK